MDHTLIPDTWREIHHRADMYYYSAIAESTASVYSKHALYWARFRVLFGMRHEYRSPSQEAVSAFSCHG